MRNVMTLSLPLNGLLIFTLGFLFCSTSDSSISLGLEPESNGSQKEDKTDSDSDGYKERVLELFTASSKKFDEGKLILNYDFETRDQDLVLDWQPHIEKTKSRVRWARGSEGTPTTVEHGIIISDVGEWVHKARFLSDLEVTVDMISVSHHRAGTILAATFFSPKKKRSLATNSGYQVVQLRGTKMARAPHPKAGRAIPTLLRTKIGYKYNGRIFACYKNEKQTNDSLGLRKFTDGFDDGHVGLAWSGSVQCFIFSVTIKGKLDPTWVEKQLK